MSEAVAASPRAGREGRIGFDVFAVPDLPLLDGTHWIGRRRPPLFGAGHRRSHACPLGAVADLQHISRSAAAEICGRHLGRGLLGRPVGWPGTVRRANPTHETFENF
jgi:hypothetical protein